MRTRTGIVAVLIAAACHAVAADSSLGSFKDWRATRFGSGDDLACMAFSQPQESRGEYTRRGDTFVFVTNRPGADSIRVSVEAGYTYQTGSTVQVEVDQLSLGLQTDGSTAWLTGEGDTQRLIAAMRAGRRMRVSGVSSRGTRTQDDYSLFGFTAAHAAINKACRR